MAKLVIISVHDNTRGTYLNFNLETNEGTAIRQFGQECARDTGKDKNMFQLFPDDFSLVVLGTYDNETGEIKPEKKPRTIAWASQYVPTNDK